MVARQSSSHGNGVYVSHNKFAALSTKASSPPSAPLPLPSINQPNRSKRPTRKEQRGSFSSGGISVLPVERTTNTPSVNKIDMSDGHAAVNGLTNGYVANGDVKEVRQRTKTSTHDAKMNGKKLAIKTDDKNILSERERISKIDWEIPRKTLHSSIGGCLTCMCLVHRQFG